MSIYGTSQHDGFLKLAQDVQCKAVEVSKDPQTHTLYVLSLDTEGTQPFTTNPQSALESTAGL